MQYKVVLTTGPVYTNRRQTTVLRLPELHLVEKGNGCSGHEYSPSIGGLLLYYYFAFAMIGYEQFWFSRARLSIVYFSGLEKEESFFAAHSRQIKI